MEHTDEMSKEIQVTALEIMMGQHFLLNQIFGSSGSITFHLLMVLFYIVNVDPKNPWPSLTQPISLSLVSSKYVRFQNPPPPLTVVLSLEWCGEFILYRQFLLSTKNFVRIVTEKIQIDHKISFIPFQGCFFVSFPCNMAV